MSFREMRNFTEMMRSLGYTRLISMENFRTPNFPLIAEILTWLVYRYDINADMPSSVDTEQDRVIFVKSVAHFMATKAHIRLNTKKLYQADGYAVKELLKVTVLLFEAMRRNSVDDDAPDTSILDVFDMTRVKELKEARQLASLITTRSARLYDLLQREVDLREVRQTAIGRQLEMTQVEIGIKASIKQVESEIERFVGGLSNIAADEANLEAKIEKKRNELTRNQKRLSTLQSVRPAYMDEYEQLEEELGTLYKSYLTRFCNLSFREVQYEELMRAELDRNDETEMTLKKMADQLRETELSIQKKTALPRGGAAGDDEDEDFQGLLDDDDGEESSSNSGEDDDDPGEAGDMVENPRKATRPGPSGLQGKTSAVDVGRKWARDEEDEVSEMDDDSDEMDDDEEDEDEDDDGNEIEVTPDDPMAAMRMGRPTRPSAAGQRGRPAGQEESDDDF